MSMSALPTMGAEIAPRALATTSGPPVVDDRLTVAPGTTARLRAMPAADWTRALARSLLDETAVPRTRATMRATSFGALTRASKLLTLLVSHFATAKAAS